MTDFRTKPHHRTICGRSPFALPRKQSGDCPDDARTSMFRHGVRNAGQPRRCFRLKFLDGSRERLDTLFNRFYPTILKRHPEHRARHVFAPLPGDSLESKASAWIPCGVADEKKSGIARISQRNYEPVGHLSTRCVRPAPSRFERIIKTAIRRPAIPELKVDIFQWIFFYFSFLYRLHTHSYNIDRNCLKYL